MQTIFIVLAVVIMAIGGLLMVHGLMSASKGNTNQMGVSLVVAGIGVIFIMAGVVWMFGTLQ